MNLMQNKEAKKIASISLAEWPSLSDEVLYFLQLKQDDVFPFIPQKDIPLIIEKATQHGEAATDLYLPEEPSLKGLYNQLLKHKCKVRFIQKEGTSAWLRAQYIKKQKRMEIYHSSIHQLQQFFTSIHQPVEKADIIRLHLYHEWFHHLEETEYPLTSTLFAKITYKKQGPFARKSLIHKTREIAAHAFTKKALGLSWSPPLLDQILLLSDQGQNKSQIRETFLTYKDQYEKIINLSDDNNL